MKLCVFMRDPLQGVARQDYEHVAEYDFSDGFLRIFFEDSADIIYINLSDIVKIYKSGV